MLPFVLAFMEYLPQMIAAGKDVVAFVEQTTTSLKAMQAENRDPSDAEWAALNAEIATLRATLDGMDTATG